MIMLEYKLTDCECWRRDEACVLWRIIVTGSEMTLARYYAKQAVKAQWQGQGIKLHHVEASELMRAANGYLNEHPELITFATERYQDFVKRGILRPPRKLRKPRQ
jgi:hypothetical protein